MARSRKYEMGVGLLLLVALSLMAWMSVKVGALQGMGDVLHATVDLPDAAVLGPVFASASHPAAPSLGASRFAALVRASPLPVYALGGIDAAAAQRIARSGAVGIAAIGALTPRAQTR